ncbi:hypothetical protein [Crossiella sp. NPDC003009]
MTIPIFYYVNLYNLHHGHLPAPRGWRPLLTFHTMVLTGWFLVIAFAILQAFWTYWSTLL